MSRRGGSGRDMVSVFVRNLHHDCRQEDLRKIFQKYGEISDVYIPMDYYKREPRGFAYVQFSNLEDAEDAIYYLDGTSLFGRAMEIQVAEGDRKTPSQMRYRGGGGPRRRRSYSRSRSRSRSPRRSGYRGGRRSRSRSPVRRSRSGSNRKRSPSRSKSRSISPRL